MACNIIGTICSATGVGRPNVVLKLSPASPAIKTAEIVGGIGLLSDAVQTLTSNDGTFSIPALAGFRYRLQIPKLNYDETFVCPDLPEVRFDLVGLLPIVADTRSYIDATGLSHVVVSMLAYRVGGVTERFDSVVLERSLSQGGPWTEVNTLDLQSDVDSYDWDDDEGEQGVYYRAKYLNTANGDESSYSDPKSAANFPEALVLSVDEFKDTFLFGVDLTDDDGRPYPLRMYEMFIKAGTSWIEHEIDIPLVAKEIVGERHDHLPIDWANWGWFQLLQYPVQEVRGITFQPQGGTATPIPTDWIQIEKDTGVLQIVPGPTVEGIAWTMQGSMYPIFGGSAGRYPGFWRVDYRAGFEPKEVPPIIKELVGKWASLGVMNIAGDLVGGAGLQGMSVSLPGLTQNVTTTNSSTNAGYGARLLQYIKEIKMVLPAVKRTYGKGTKLAVA